VAGAWPGGAPALGTAQHAALDARKRHALHVLLAALVTVWSVVLVSWSADPVTKGVVKVIQDLESRRISTTNWPARDWRDRRPLPVKVNAIDRPDELLYFKELLPLLEAGADNRLNMHRVLTTRRKAGEYPALHAVYHHRQRDVLRRLTTLAVPARLAEIHGRILTATEQQIAAFAALVDAKAKDPEIDLRHLRSHPAIQTANHELHEAWELVRRMYPTLDHATKDAIESRFRQLDVD